MNIPKHVAIILDGNGRWAKSKGMPRNYGHTVGAKNVETVCQAAHDLGINPTNDGKVIRLIFPELTEERRKELAKDVKKKGENAKVAIRNIRRDANDMLKKQNKANEISDDEQKQQEDKVQKLTDKFIAEIDKAIDNKSKEILTV